jgi:uncharacterized protein
MQGMKPFLSRFLTVVEVISVAFALVPFLTLGLYRLFPGFEIWQMQAGFNVPILFYIVSIAVPLIMARLRRKRPAAYGIDFRNLKYQLDITLICFIPVALFDGLNAVIKNPNSWIGAMVQIVAQAILLVLLGRLLRKKPSAPMVGLLMGAGLIFMPGFTPASHSIAGKVVMLVMTYALFVGFGEEILFRGYIQSRLNEVFGRPWKFSGVSFGWGALLTSFLFGLMHVGVQRWILGLNNEITLAWGVWTIFSGLVFSFIREKSGSILAPALLHGLPQAIASVARLFL